MALVRVLAPTLAMLLLATLAPTARSAQTSFDCSKASHAVEKLVCSDDTLAGLDQTLAADYKKAMQQVSGSDQEDLRTSQAKWIKSRNDCAKQQDAKACVLESYRTRIAILGAKYGFVPVSAGTFLFTCDDTAKTSFYATFFNTDPPTMNLVSQIPGAEKAETLVRGMSGSGARYEGDNGIVFWNKGNDAQIEWPAGKDFNCSTDGKTIGE